jgi:hypothetical protein
MEVVHMEKANQNMNEWTEDIEQYVRKIANRNGAMQWMHNKTADSYNFGNKIWSIIVGILIAACGSSGIPTIITDNIAATLAFQGVTIAAGIVVIVQALVALGELASEHQDAGTRNSEQFLFILKELQEPTYKLRIRGTRFLHMVLEQEVAIKNKEIHIPSRHVKQYYRKFGKKAVPYNELFGEDDVMHIDDNMLKTRSHENSIVNQIMAQSIELRRTQQLHGRQEPLLDDLDEQLKEHDQKHTTKYKRNVPPPHADHLRIIENYLNTV